MHKMCKNPSLSAVPLRFGGLCFMAKHNIYLLLLLLSRCVFIRLSALPSICQSIHLSSSICHFSCHLNHPPIRPSIFQATHTSTFHCISFSFICPSCLLCVATLLWSQLLSAELWWQLRRRERPARSRAFTPTRPNTPVPLSTPQHIQRHAASHDLMYLFHLPCQVSCCSWARLSHTLEGFSAK